MVKIYESRFPPSPNIGKVTVSFDKLNNTDLFLQIHRVCLIYTLNYKIFICYLPTRFAHGGSICEV